MTCCKTCGGSEGNGACDGGIPIKAWQYLNKFGGVTGGNYNTTDVSIHYINHSFSYSHNENFEKHTIIGMSTV